MMQVAAMTAGILKILRRHPLATYFALAYIWTCICWWSVVANSDGQFSLPISNEALATVGQFGPFAAAVFVTFVTQGRDGLREFASRFLRWRAQPIWLVVALFLLPGTMLVAICIYASFDGSIESLRFCDNWTTLPLHFVYLLLLGGPLGEEPGWRGFALPRLQDRFGPWVGSLWLGLLHAGWHLPLWWMRRPPCPFWMYVIGVIFVTYLFTWLFNHTMRSVLYSLIFHTSLSIASVRFPDVPAYHLWIVVLLVVVLIVAFCDRRLGQHSRELANGD
jgi:membrane protease YdiL (CAAX protease family)